MWFSSLRNPAVAGILAAAAGVSALPQTSNSNNGDACNNSPSLCSKKYNEVTYLGAHNSYALRDDTTNDSLSGNQYFNATVALDAGLRLLQVQTHQGNATLELCHSSCDMLDAGPLEDWLAKINAWMDDNPNEVVTVIVANEGDAPASEFNRALQASGIAQKAYTAASDSPPSEWPTLRDMIDENMRFVLFATKIDFSPATPAVLPEFDFVFETHFEVTTLGGFNCTVDRPSRFSASASGALQQNYLSLVNHFKYAGFAGIQLPDVDTIETVNSAAVGEEGSLGTHLQQCRREWDTVPNFVLVDFWDEADPLAAVDSMNQVEEPAGRDESAVTDGGRNAAGRVGAGEKMAFGALVAFLSAAVVLV